MPLTKPRKDWKVAILFPNYKRPEYGERCLKALEEAQEYNGSIFVHPGDNGLRAAILDFFKFVKSGDFDIIAKMDNDCEVPKNWLNNILDVFDTQDVDILSPDVFPSKAAHKHGLKVHGLPYMPSDIVGGLWVMKAELIKDMRFSEYDVRGIQGAIPVLKQIIYEKEPKIGWVPSVVVQDIGHWSGAHPDHIKSQEHLEYSLEIGREVAWA